jgi:HD domain
MQSLAGPSATFTRRQLLKLGAAAAVLSTPLLTLARAMSRLLPREVAGIAIPQSDLAIRVAALSKSACPLYLFNHCLRTFVFGGIFAAKQHLQYRAEEAFIAACLHDVGLLPAYASAGGSFEIDGANAADTFAREAGLDAAAADTIWHSVAFHDGRWAIAKRAGPEAMLVSFGAGTDVDGADPKFIDSKQVADVVSAFPRLHFKREFTGLLIDHCKRKPVSQEGTWLEGLCREQVPDAWKDTVEAGIANAPYAE